MKREKQVEESKTMIGSALLSLLKHSELKDIPISRITTKAKVSRVTFYRNFESKEDIVLFILKSFANEINESLKNISSPTIDDLIHIQYKLLKNRSDMVFILFRDNTRDILRLFRKDTIKTFNSIIGDIDKYTMEFNIGGLDYIMADWIHRGMIESPSEMTKITTKLMVN